MVLECCEVVKDFIMCEGKLWVVFLVYLVVID